eukprot:TRINITY_DN10638_c0_g1_i1.p1 TRINITY_DN10638_c0_g1~~TRINITY_DN10638_c0_g1_i1.p1  ORF type:complete len:251 (-),score=96.50 TRINITY_DN10638_c0_g1_i1:396-1148(-)
MPVFECQKCNETVKKPKLGQHLMRCGAPWFVTCIDCNQTFNWDTWESHTKCISEAQKYQGHLFTEKESTNKGQKKQDQWIDAISNVVEDASSGIAADVRQLMTKLLGFDNIPRKQKPFGNFVKNSLKLWDDKKIEAMWKVVEQAGNAAKAAAEKAKAEEAAAKAKAADWKAAAEEANGKGKWAGWKRALDDELKTAGGELPWKKLRKALVKQYQESGMNGASSEDILGAQALAAIPESYLSKKDDLVRLP